MALLWADGFDHYGTVGNMTLGAYTQASVVLTNNVNNVRTGNYAIDVSGGDNAQRILSRSIGNFQGETIGIGFAIQTTSNPPPTHSLSVGVVDASGGAIWTATFNSALGIDVRQGDTNGDIIVSTPPLVLTPGSYSYVEIAVIMDPVQGQVAIRVNNAQKAAISNVNTIGVGTGAATFVNFYKPGGASSTWPSWYVDDFVFWDATGADNNSFFGDIRCRTIFPEANGANQDWTEVGADPAFNCVNQVPPQPGVDYITAPNVGNLSSFDMQAVPVNTGAIHGVVLHSMLNKADAGICGVTAGVGSQGSTAFSDVINPGTGAAYYSTVFQTDPHGGPWTANNVNNVQAIVERVQ